MDKPRGTKTVWWTWVQFAVLCISIPTNVFLWLDRRSQESEQREAQYMTESWKALADFEVSMGSLNREVNQKVGVLANHADLIDRLRAGELEWLASALRNTTELASRIRSYEAASRRDLPARKYAAMAVKRQMAPPPLFWHGGCSNVSMQLGKQMLCASYDAPEGARLVAAWDVVFEDK